jgi:hypothetical protein
MSHCRMSETDNRMIHQNLIFQYVDYTDSGFFTQQYKTVGDLIILRSMTGFFNGLLIIPVNSEIHTDEVSDSEKKIKILLKAYRTKHPRYAAFYPIYQHG